MWTHDANENQWHYGLLPLIDLYGLMPLTHRFLKNVRAIHLYLGVFTAPALLFFAITGGLQSFGLHEAARNSSDKPPAWLVSAAQLHKKQTLVKPQRRRAPAAAIDARKTRDAESTPADSAKPAVALEKARGSKPAAKNLWPMKIFFGLVAVSLLVSVLSGLFMAWRFSRRPMLMTAIVAGGVVTPLLLLLF